MTFSLFKISIMCDRVLSKVIRDQAKPGTSWSRKARRCAARACVALPEGAADLFEIANYLVCQFIKYLLSIYSLWCNDGNLTIQKVKLPCLFLSSCSKKYSSPSGTDQESQRAPEGSIFPKRCACDLGSIKERGIREQNV